MLKRVHSFSCFPTCGSFCAPGASTTETRTFSAPGAARSAVSKPGATGGQSVAGLTENYSHLIGSRNHAQLTFHDNMGILVDDPHGVPRHTPVPSIVVVGVRVRLLQADPYRSLLHLQRVGVLQLRDPNQ